MSNQRRSERKFSNQVLSGFGWWLHQRQIIQIWVTLSKFELINFWWCSDPNFSHQIKIELSTNKQRVLVLLSI